MHALTLRFNEDKAQKIILGGDIHAGLRNSLLSDAEEMFKRVNSVRTWYIGMGDYCEFREPGHQYYDTDNIEMTIEEQLSWLFGQLRPIKKKIVGLLVGNHERGLIRKYTLNPLRMWCEDNGVSYLGDMTHITLEFPCGQSHTLIVHHGYGGGQQKGGKVNRLSRFINQHDVDMVAIGHVHALLDWIETELSYNKDGEPKARNKHCMFTGSFLRTYAPNTDGSYGEMNMMEPLPMGYIEMTVKPSEEINIRKVIL